MILDTFALPNDVNVISANFQLSIKIRGVKVIVELEPSCWVGRRKLGIYVRGKNLYGGSIVSKKSFKTSTFLELDMLIKKIKLGKCAVPGCKGNYLKTNQIIKTNSKRLCAKHFELALNRHYRKVTRKQHLHDSALDDKKVKLGYKYKVIVWIHPKNGDDYFFKLYYKTKPSSLQIKKYAIAKKSLITNDYKIITLMN
ncbi:MAG: hypothetical protein LW821_15670 [Flammeovirgaceae bacterium]|jgi:hypothetical protein|nr:hypothetical protein [Flammeovirgaceae bacterium]